MWKHCKECRTCQKYKPWITKLSGHAHSRVRVHVRHRYYCPIAYLLVIVDYCSKWTELFPLRVAKSPQMAAILVKDSFTRWGSPVYLQGVEVTSQLLNSICNQWRVIQKLTMAYHPQTNLTECINHTSKIMVSSYVQGHHREWDRWIAEFTYPCT